MSRLEPARASELFAAQRIARLATVDDEGRPHLVPVVFAVRGATVVIAVDDKPKAGRNLKRLRNIRANHGVSVLADRYDEDWSTLWWVRADGTATVLTEPADMSGPIDWLVAKYQQYQRMRPAGPVIRITVTTWTGWSATP